MLVITFGFKKMEAHVFILTCSMLALFGSIQTSIVDIKHKMIAEKLRYVLFDPFHQPHHGTATPKDKYTTTPQPTTPTTHKIHKHKTTTTITPKKKTGHKHTHKHQLLTHHKTFFGKVRKASEQLEHHHGHHYGNTSHTHGTKKPHTHWTKKPHTHWTKKPHPPKTTITTTTKPVPNPTTTTTTTTKPATTKKPFINHPFCDVAGVKCKKCYRCKPAGFCILHGHQLTGRCICHFGFTGTNSRYQAKPASLNNIIRADSCDVPCVYGPFTRNPHCVGTNPSVYPRLPHLLHH